jgi:hypothetical protein
MSFIRYGWPLKYFKDTSHEYVFVGVTGNDNKIEDYGSKYEHKPSMIELMAGFILICTASEEYTWKMVKIMAKDCGVKHLLRKKPATSEQIWKEMDRICHKDIKKYKSCTAPFGKYCSKHGVVHKEK